MMEINMPRSSDIEDKTVRAFAEFVESQGYLLVTLRDFYWGDRYSFTQWNFYFASEDLSNFWSVFKRDPSMRGSVTEWPQISFDTVYGKNMFIVQCNMKHIKLPKQR
jgi:hypothetical protein